MLAEIRSRTRSLCICRACLRAPELRAPTSVCLFSTSLPPRRCSAKTDTSAQRTAAIRVAHRPVPSPTALSRLAARRCCNLARRAGIASLYSTHLTSVTCQALLQWDQACSLSAGPIFGGRGLRRPAPPSQETSRDSPTSSRGVSCAPRVMQTTTLRGGTRCPGSDARCTRPTLAQGTIN